MHKPLQKARSLPHNLLTLILIPLLLLVGCKEVPKKHPIRSTLPTIIVPPLDLEVVEPLKLRSFKFIEGKCLYKLHEEMPREAYACLEKVDLQSLLYNLQYLKARSTSLESKLRAYQDYYEGGSSKR